MDNITSIANHMSQVDNPFSFKWIFWAIVLGLIVALIINMGPVFITLVQTSLHQDFKSAVFFAFGVVLNDALVIAILIFIFSSVDLGISFDSGVPWFYLGAGAIVVLFGVVTFFKKARNKDTRQEQRAKELMEIKDDCPSPFAFIGKGFALNVLNPGVWLFWSVFVAIVVKGTGNPIFTIIFFSIVLGISFSLDILKAWGAAKLKRFFDADRTTLMNRIAGVLLVIIGLYFIVFKGIIDLV